MSEGQVTGAHSRKSLSPEQSRHLLDLARSAITTVVTTGLPYQSDLNDRRVDIVTGVFVTLRQQTANGLTLRGCIGRPLAERSLSQLVPLMAVKAATEDPRFPALTSDELPEIKIELSLLSLFTPLLDPAQIVVGTHGLYVRGDGRVGLLLPEVAVRQQWNGEQFLEGVCQKAGLPAQCWRQGNCDLDIFSTEVVVED